MARPRFPRPRRNKPGPPGAPGPHGPQGRSRRPRTALSAVREHRGVTRWSGDPSLGPALAAALDAGHSPDSRGLTHGFHTYPARMHPAIARALVARAAHGETIADPFCGGGTVLVEAVAAGHSAVGVDASPLAVRLARLKASIWPADALARLVDRARRVSAFAAGRADRARGERLPGFDPKKFAPHVFRELHFLGEAIASGPDDALAEALRLVLSAIIVKVSEQRSETAAHERAQTRLAAGFTSRHFAHKADELASGLEALARITPRGTPPARALEGDARALPPLGVPRVHRVISSPPYPGVYDYAEHHALRCAFLGIDPGQIAAQEIGARRRSRRPGARARWQADLQAVLSGLGRVLAPGGSIVLLLGDGVLESQAVHADESVRDAAAQCGLTAPAVAWQQRPAFSREEQARFGGAKREVLIALSQR